MSAIQLRVVLAVCGTAGALLLGLAGGAGADVPRVTVGGQVSLTFDPPGHFEGRVDSRRKPCERRRRAHLNYWMMPSGPPDDLGADRTNRRGRYEIDVEPFAIAGEYQTVVERKVVHRDDETIVCRRIRSIKHQF